MSNPFNFPDLPIITPPVGERMSNREKYGGMFYLGLAGLAAILGLIAWFGYGLAANWSMWTDIYRLHDASRPEDERIVAADRLARDPRVNQRHYWDMLQRSDLPDLARYRLAEALTAEATAADPASYALSVAETGIRPTWLQALLVRPMALAVNRGIAFPEVPVRALRQTNDPLVQVFAGYVQALQQGGDPQALRDLQAVARGEGPARAAAERLVASLNGADSERSARIEEAARLLRRDQAEAAKLWAGWRDEGGRLIRVAAPDLHAK